MAWYAVGAAAVSVVGGYLNSKNAKTVGTTGGQSGFDPLIQAGESQAVTTAENIANQPFQYYDPNMAVAGLSPNQTLAAQSAEAGGQYIPEYQATAGQTFDAGTVSKYSNPYVTNVLDAQRAIAQKNYATQMAQLQSKEGMSNAFGGDRSALAESQLTQNFNLNDNLMTQSGLKNAYDAGVSAFQQDRSFAAGQVGQAESALSSTGGVQQTTAQNRANFGYNQFTQARDWQKTQNQYLTSTLAAVPKGSYYSGNQTSQYVPGSGGWGGALAGAAQIGMMGYNNNPNGPNGSNNPNNASYWGGSMPYDPGQGQGAGPGGIQGYDPTTNPGQIFNG